MSIELSLAERRVNRAYEVGRLRHAASFAIPIFGIAAGGLFLSDRAPVFYAIAVVFALLPCLYVWRGGDAGNALLPGIVAGLVPLVLSATLLDCSSECSGVCLRHCMLVCAAGSTAAGLVASVLTRHHPRQWKVWLFAAALVPASGLLGCPHVGYGQIGGLLLGLVVSRGLTLVVGGQKASP